jgi:hypothetical protein
MDLREIDLDQRGFDYVLDHLRGVNTLCDALARVVEQHAGRVFTVAPIDTDLARAHAFKAGGLLAENHDLSKAIALGPGQGSLMPVASLHDVRAAMIVASLEARPGAVCICDDFNPRWPDGASADCATAFGVDAETYHLLAADLGVDAIASTLGWSDTIWHGVAAVCRQDLSMPPDRTVTAQLMRQCASSVIELSCTAYDGEGFVVWKRR